jgi:hypothetical protein
VHFLGDEDARARVLVMEIVQHSAGALQHDTLLLPLIHSLWKPLVSCVYRRLSMAVLALHAWFRQTRRFRDREAYVVVQSASLVARLARLCPQFIRSRIVQYEVDT